MKNIYDDKIDKCDGIKVNKNNGYYVSNPKFYEEMVKSLKQNKLTDNAVSMIVLICQNLSNRMNYENPDDREDCIGFAVLDCLQYWNRFNPEKGNNPFAYFTSVASNGYAKAWRKLGKYNFPASIMSSLSSGNIHSI